MKQILRKGLKDIVVEEVPDPVLTPHHVIVRPGYSLISSGTETASIHKEGLFKEVRENPSHLEKIWKAMRANGPTRTLSEVLAKFSEYAVLGYSGAGVVAAKHSTVTDLEVGDRVTYGGEGTGHGELILTGRNLVARIPDEVSLQQACFTTLGSIALNAVRTAKIELGETVVIIGLGIVGQLVTQLARNQGGVTIAVDLRSDRVELAKQLGADQVFSDDVAPSTLALTNGVGADVVIVAAAAKSAGPCEQALRLCRDRGRIVVVGAVEMSFPWHEMYLKEIQVSMSRAYGPGSYDSDYEKGGHDYPLPYVRWTENRNMEEFLRLVAKRRVRLEPLISHEFPLIEAERAYETIMAPGSNSLAVVLKYPVEFAEGQVPSDSVARVDIATQNARDGDIRVAVVGAGNLARWIHLPDLKRTPNVAVRSVCSTNGARAKSYARRFGAAYCCSDYEEVIRDPEVDMVVILTRNQHHATQTISALRAGKHVFVEKPMALSQEECVKIYQAVRETGKQLTVGFNRRFAPFYRQQKEQLRKRKGPAVLNCLMNSPGISGSYWMANPEIGGAILGEACHFVDLMYWLLDSEPISVSAYSLPTQAKEPIGQNNIAASFHFADGSIGNLTYCTVGDQAFARERVDAFAPGIAIEVEDFKRLTTSAGLRKKRSQIWPEKGYGAQWTSVIENLRAGKAPDVTVIDGIRSTLGCLKMLEAARTSKPASIDLTAILDLPNHQSIANN